MAKNSVWQDDYWLMLMQAYLRRPVGMKPVYSREMVELSMELHIHPKALNRRMQQIDRLETPRIERIWKQYSTNPKRLARAVRLLREMNGFGAADDFYEGVEVQETFERDFRPLAEDKRFTPAMLIILLDLYYQLTPSTMISETPDVGEVAKLLKISADEEVDVLNIYQLCDPCLKRHDFIIHPLLEPCQQIWQRYGNDSPEKLAALAAQLKDYFLK